MLIRRATKSDYYGIWAIFREVIKTGDTYGYDPQTKKEGLERHWFGPNQHPYVALMQDDIIGSYFIRPNQAGAGSHIANASYMVHPDHRGKGIGEALCRHSIATAKQMGFRGMQFNMVVSTNTSAIYLWKKCGFEIIGTVPKGYKHATKGFVDAYIMYRDLV
jgi:L-amino acid N-acyltransferase YncA